MTRFTQSLLIARNGRPRASIVVVVFLGLALIGGTAFGGGWTQVFGDGITDMLSGKHVIYEGREGVSQTFHVGGSTTYVDGRPSMGSWRASDTQYCSQWPPSGGWDCYDFFKDSTGMRIRFLGAGGDE